MSLALIVLAIALAAVSGLPSAFMRRGSAWGQRVAVLLVVIACAAGLAGAFRGLFEPPSASLALPWPAVGDSLLGLDPLSAFFLVPIFLVGALASIYGLDYWPARKNPRTARRLQLFLGLMLAGMALLVVARQALAFLLGWEAMALSGFFLITVQDQRKENRRAGFIYLVATHVSTLTLFAMFILWRRATGSFDLEPAASLGVGAMNGIFFLSLLGFGLKAGAMPLHFWLPGAHAEAPSHVSALLSGVVLKMGIYGLLRMLSLLPSLPAAWGALILLLGAVSGLLGVAFALAQHDIKKLLAYHSVENIGIILMGLGVALLGRAGGRADIFALGLAGCLLHVWNHSLFKSLLFLGSGSVVHATGTKAIDRLGGLAKLMPWTAAFFLVGAVAICGLPPLNGFISELFIYLGLFGGLAKGGVGPAMAALAAPVLAMIGSLAVACFVKVFGVSFLGNARSPEAEKAKESPAAMLLPMAVLAGACALIGLAPALLPPILDPVVACWNSAAAPVPGSAWSLASLPSVGALAPLWQLGAAGVAVLAVVLLFTLVLSRKGRAAPRRPTWDCGYARPTSSMQYTASSFARGIVGMFAWALHPKPEPGKIQGAFPEKTSLHGEVDEAILDRAIVPALQRAERLSTWFHRFQQGLTQQYLLYLLIALIALLATQVPFDQIALFAFGGAGGAR